MPAQLVECLSLQVVFECDDGVVFPTGDGPFLFELNHRPLALHHHRPRQPPHVQREVVNAAEENIRRDRADIKHLEKMFRLCFQNRQVANQIKRLVLEGA